MTNSNCLADMRCPRCGSEGPFNISGGALFTVADDGVGDFHFPEWNADSSCDCCECRHSGIVNDFTIEYQTEAEPDVTALLLKAAKDAFEALERISDALHYQDGECVTFLEANEIDLIYHDALSPLVELSAAIDKAEGRA